MNINEKIILSWDLRKATKGLPETSVKWEMAVKEWAKDKTFSSVCDLIDIIEWAKKPVSQVKSYVRNRREE